MGPIFVFGDGDEYTKIGEFYRNQMVEIAVGGRRKLERSKANVVQRFVVDAERFVRVLHQLVDGQRGVVRFHDRVRHFRRRHYAERVHDPVGILLAYLRYQQGAHAGARAAAQRMSQLEPL